MKVMRSVWEAMSDLRCAEVEESQDIRERDESARDV